MQEQSDLAVKIGDQFILIQESSEGMDYSVFNKNYFLVDGGVVDVEGAQEALKEIIQMHDIPKLEIENVDFDELFEQTTERELEEIDSKISVLAKVDKMNESIKPKIVGKNTTVER
ncbi:LPD16 domain-containing protein [Listeria monocytogenes]|uniref:LPD16 domain-containing protein n=1 Tax=Listeria monocytogenes TaxID=1639 RepID=UPI000775615E|nr:LPD16 domain-containing protein [Listeria monocytogenes]EAD2655552.1 hypothetical protein [Listeria monocytogenes]KXS60505.1 hypothetical protein AWJ01_05535 [Listeria monocytogenes]TYU88654.1 hypothetical protein FZX01_03860 [Listeria monocytogenes]